MEVIIDQWAWLPKSELPPEKLRTLRDKLTIHPSEYQPDGSYEQGAPIFLYVEDAKRDMMGIAREYFFTHRRPGIQLVSKVSEGGKWPGDLQFNGELREEQQRGKVEITSMFEAGKLGGILKAPPAFGKTVAALSIIAAMRVPTLVVLHKEFLVGQWRKRIKQFLPDAKVGLCQQDKCTYRGKHIVLGMVHSLAAGKRYPKPFYNWPGLVITDEVHRVGAATWSRVPTMFPAKHRLGLTATDRRKDGAQNVFYYHIGPVIFESKEKRLGFKVKRVWTRFMLRPTPRFNPNLASAEMLTNLLVADDRRNQRIADQIIKALVAGRKLLVLSHRLRHLDRLHKLVITMWDQDKLGLPYPSVGYYVGGKSEADLDEAAEKQLVFATAQLASEAMDIPPLDTLFLTTPMSDVEQAIGRILRPWEGKKEPIVVDFRDDNIKVFRKRGETREKWYERLQRAA